MTTTIKRHTGQIPGKTEKPRCFLLRWNNCKDPTYGKGRNIWKECYCVRFPNGWIATDFGPAYKTMHDLEAMLNEAGEYSIQWLDADGQERDAC